METENMVNEMTNLAETEAATMAFKPETYWRTVVIDTGLMVLGGLMAVGGKKMLARLKAKLAAKKAKKPDLMVMTEDDFKIDDLED